MTDKYRYTASELFKLRMQFKAEVNELRKTYHEFVIEKHSPEKKHFFNSFTIPSTSIVPEQERSLKKDTREKRHYSPIVFTPTNERTSMSCKKQFGNMKNNNNLSEVIAQKCQSKKKSLSQALLSKNNRTSSINNVKKLTIDTPKSKIFQQAEITPRSGIKIIPKYHQYDNRFLG